MVKISNLKIIGDDRVTAIGMGTWGIGGYESPDYSRDRESVEVLRYGLELGINLIDTAEFYRLRGWDEELGVPLPETMEELGYPEFKSDAERALEVVRKRTDFSRP